MRLAVNLTAVHAVVLAREAERLGFSTVFVPEGVCGDAISVLSWLAAKTERIGLASGVCQIPARTPVTMAMTAATLDQLSGGRFRLGLGISNSYVTEAWHGQPFAQPSARTREYIKIIRIALARKPIVFHGDYFRLPRYGNGLQPFVVPGKPIREDLPIILAAVGPRGLRLAGSIADAWLGTFCSPERATESVRHLCAGREAVGASLVGFDTILSVPLHVTTDLEEGARPIAEYVAMFVSMGPAQQNQYYRVLATSGYEAQAAHVHRLSAAGDQRAAAAAVPSAFVDSVSLLGSVDRIADRMKAFSAAGITTLAVSPNGATREQRVAALRVAAEALSRAGVAD